MSSSKEGHSSKKSGSRAELDSRLAAANARADKAERELAAMKREQASKESKSAANAKMLQKELAGSKLAACIQPPVWINQDCSVQ